MTQLTWSDASGVTEEDGENILDYELFKDGRLWLSLENVDGEFTCFISKEQWVVIRNALDAAFNLRS